MSDKAKNRAGTRKKRPKYFLIYTVVIIVLLTGLIGSLLMILSLSSEKDKLNEELIDANTEVQSMKDTLANAYTKSQVEEMVTSASSNASLAEEKKIKGYIKDTMSTKEGNTAELLRSLFPEYVVYKGADGYTFGEIDKSIPANPYSNSDLVKNEDGQMTYIPNGEAHYLTGIDVSQHQGNINWEKVSEAGIDYAFIRVGIRGYGSGKLVLDEQFENNIKGALENGIEVGVYFFSQATTEEEIKEELDFVLEAIAPYKITYPVAIDIEKIEDSSARGNLISREDRTHYADIFCKGIEDAGYTPMIYGNLFSLFSMLDMSRLYQYDTWFAFYDKYLYYPYTVHTWQYTDSLTVPGISNKVDGNITFTN